MLHEVPLAFHRDLIYPGDSKPIPEVGQVRLDSGGAQPYLDRKLGLAIERDLEINFAAGADSEPLY